MTRWEVVARPLGAIWTLFALTVTFAITIPLAGLYMLGDLVWTLAGRDFPIGRSVAGYHSGVYTWAAGNWLWVTTGDGSFDLIPGYEPDELT